jgi:hypothetical protein
MEDQFSKELKAAIEEAVKLAHEEDPFTDLKVIDDGFDWGCLFTWWRTLKRFFKNMYKRFDLVKIPDVKPWGYSDNTHRMMIANFELVRDFVDSGEIDTVVWDHDKEHEYAYETIMDIYTFYNTKQNSLEAVDFENHKLIQDMLHKCIDVRPYLWT